MNTSMKTLKTTLLAALLAAFSTGCGGGSLFFAELEEPGICKTMVDVPMAATPPGQTLTMNLTIDLASRIPMFDATATGTNIRFIELTFWAKSGINDFNSVDTAEVLAVPDPSSQLQTTQVLSYTKSPGFVPGTQLTVAADQGVELVPFLANGNITVETRMTGGLPNNSWTADIRGCLYMKSKVNYLEGYGITF
jgi:hypothetical protein